MGAAFRRRLVQPCRLGRDGLNPPWGIDGGRPGLAVVNPGTPQERRLAALSDGNMVKKGDILRIETGGGGGHGHPYDRPEAAVLEDVLAGFVTSATARDLYGVVIDDDHVDATAALRAIRPATRRLHRQDYVDALN